MRTEQDNRPAQTTVDIIGYDSGWGGADFGCEDGPAAIAYDQLIQKLRALDIATQWGAPLGLKHLGRHSELNTKDKTLPILRECLHRLMQRVTASTANGHIPLVIGGDHAAAMGTWPGVISATKSAGRFGLIWLDAHLDAHTYETSSEGKWGGWWHGQPIAALTGHGLPALTGIGGSHPKISPQHISIIGAHSFEAAEAAFVKKHNIQVVGLDEIEKRGFTAVFQDALTRATDGTNGFGLSIDMDGFAPLDAPGVATREPHGMAASAVLPALQGIGRHPLFRALEIVEFNPHKDQATKTANLILQLVETAFGKPLP